VVHPLTRRRRSGDRQVPGGDAGPALHVDLPHRVAHLGLPHTTVTAVEPARSERALPHD
jgi:hypothetical protein